MTKIKREAALVQFPKFPLTDARSDTYYYPKSFSHCTLTLESKSVRGHVTQLSVELIKLMQGLNASSLIFMGDHAGAWLRQENDYKPVREAMQYFERMKIGVRFNGALKIDIPQLSEFIGPLFWLTRCNGAFPDVHFMNEQQDFLGNICKYGNLHFSTLNKKTDLLFQNAMQHSNFKIMTTNCTNMFSRKPAIAGRQTIV